MGQAKRRGTYEQRRSSPHPPPAVTRLTPEDLTRIQREMSETLDTIRRQLFQVSPPRKSKPRRIRTGG